MTAAIRDAEERDFLAILQLNGLWEHVTSPLDVESLAALHEQAAYHRVAEIDGRVAGFLLAFAPGAQYESPNYLWFDRSDGDFLYIDRVVVDGASQGSGVGALLYADVLAYARERGVGRLVCEVDIEPLNASSDAFHKRLGFVEVGTQYVGDGLKRVSLRERVIQIRTERLLLRRWRPEDRAPFAALNADPEVVAFLPKPLTRAESDAMIERIERHFDEHGFGAWAVEAVGGEGFIGLVGLAHVGFDAPFVPAVEIGWRLSRESWGCGYATEAARAALAYGFDTVGLEQVVAFAVPANTRSTAIMERIGMTRDPAGDFDHPSLPAGHPLRRHLLYRITPP